MQGTKSLLCTAKSPLKYNALAARPENKSSFKFFLYTKNFTDYEMGTSAHSNGSSQNSNHIWWHPYLCYLTRIKDDFLEPQQPNLYNTNKYLLIGHLMPDVFSKKILAGVNPTINGIYSENSRLSIIRNDVIKDSQIHLSIAKIIIKIIFKKICKCKIFCWVYCKTLK